MCHHSLRARTSLRVPMTISGIRSCLCLLTERGKGNPSTWGVGHAQNRKAQTRSLGPVKTGFHHCAWQEARSISCEIPVGPVTGCGEYWQRKGGSRYAERGSRKDSAPRRVRPDPQGPPGGKKRFCVPSLTQQPRQTCRPSP